MGFARRRRNQEVKADADGVPIQSFDIECPRLATDSKRRYSGRTYDRQSIAVLGPFTAFQLVLLTFTFMMCVAFMKVFYLDKGLGVAPLNEDLAFFLINTGGNIGSSYF